MRRGAQTGDHKDRPYIGECLWGRPSWSPQRWSPGRQTSRPITRDSRGRRTGHTAPERAIFNDGKVLEAGRPETSGGLHGEAISAEKSLQSAERIFSPGRLFSGGRSQTFASALRERQSKSAVESSECLRSFGFSRLGRSMVWVSSACHRSTRPIQKALSFALRAAAASRRHSSARRRNSSTLTSRPSFGRPSSPLFAGRVFTNCIKLEISAWLNFSRAWASTVKFFGRRRLDSRGPATQRYLAGRRAPRNPFELRKPHGPMRHR